MNLYIDDLRIIPKDFLGARNYEESISNILKNKDNINILSLDHDIASFDNTGREKTGYDICLFLCENCISPNKIFLHTDNVVGRDNMYSLLTRAVERGFINSRIYRYPFVENRYE